MSTDEQQQTPISTAGAAGDAPASAATSSASTAENDKERAEKILKAKELYSKGSRNLLVKCYADAADELSQVCSLYAELHGDLADELAMPYLLYAKSLVALALDENKVIDVPDEEADYYDEEDDELGDDEEGDEAEANGEAAVASSTSTNGESKAKLETIKEDDKKTDEADSTEGGGGGGDEKTDAEVEMKEGTKATSEETQVSSSNDNNDQKTEKAEAGSSTSTTAAETGAVEGTVVDDEKPSTSNGKPANGDAAEDVEDDENDVASSLQLAWEILELAGKIFKRQGLNGLPNLAEVHTELGNIEFENSILEGAREDYEKALKIYQELPTNYRRAMAEIHYKIGLTYLMQQMNKEGAQSLKEACNLIEGEIQEIKSKDELTEKDKNNVQDMEETKQEIWAKIAEIEETQAQNLAEVRAALDSYIKPITSGSSTSTNGAAAASSSSSAKGNEGAASSSSSASISSSSKPNDITHLIKRKKPEDHNSEAEAASPAKRPAV